MQPFQIYEGQWLSIIAITQKAVDFFEEMTELDWRNFQTCADSLDRALQETRHKHSQLLQRISGSRERIYEIRVTRRKTKGPQVRLLCVFEERTLLVVRGLVKRQSKIGRRDIELANRAAAEYRARDGPPR